MLDIVIRNGIIIDGTGKKQFMADVGIKDDLIYEIGNLSDIDARKSIDATGKFVVPGFIDSGSHSDTYWTIFTNPLQESLVCQGITTVIGGNCGSSLAPLINKESIQSIQKWVHVDRVNIDWGTMKEFLDRMETHSIGVNFATLVGHGTLRRSYTYDESRGLTEEERSQMGYALEQSMREGAFGFSSGLAYGYNRLNDEGEIYEFARIVDSFSGVYATHLRNEMSLFQDAVREALDVALKTGVRTHISHLKVLGQFYWNGFDKALEEIEKYTRVGAEITFGVFPYTATGSVLYTVLPEWASRGGKKMMLARLRDPNSRRDIIEDTRRKQLDYSKIRVALATGHNQDTLEAMADRQGIDPEEVILNLLLAHEGRVIVFMDLLSEENIRHALVSPHSIVATDGVGYSLEHKKKVEKIHPRSFGAFPRILGKYVREEGLLTWEEAIFKMTEFPARIFGIQKRGSLREGYFADVTVIDPNIISDTATFEKPYQFAKGIEYVLVNGQVVIDEGLLTKGLFGRVLRRTA